MRTLLIVSVLLIGLAPGCQALRRVEVWKQQTIFAPRARKQVVETPMAPAAASPASPTTVFSPWTPPATVVPTEPGDFSGPDYSESFYPPNVDDRGPVEVPFDAETVAPGPIVNGGNIGPAVEPGPVVVPGPVVEVGPIF